MGTISVFLSPNIEATSRKLTLTRNNVQQTRKPLVSETWAQCRSRNSCGSCWCRVGPESTHRFPVNASQSWPSLIPTADRGGPKMQGLTFHLGFKPRKHAGLRKKRRSLGFASSRMQLLEQGRGLNQNRCSSGAENACNRVERREQTT